MFFIWIFHVVNLHKVIKVGEVKWQKYTYMSLIQSEEDERYSETGETVSVNTTTSAYSAVIIIWRTGKQLVEFGAGKS